VPSALTIQPAIWFVPLSFVSRAGETPLFGFPALWHRYEAADSIRRVPGLRFVRIPVSHRLYELFCIISRPVPRLISSRKHLWAFLYRGFPSSDGPRALTRFHPLVLLRYRWPPHLLSRVLGRYAIRSPLNFRVLSVVRVRSRGLQCLAAGPVAPLLRLSFLGSCPQRSIGNPFRPPPLVPFK